MKNKILIPLFAIIAFSLLSPNAYAQTVEERVTVLEEQATKLESDLGKFFTFSQQLFANFLEYSNFVNKSLSDLRVADTALMEKDDEIIALIDTNNDNLQTALELIPGPQGEQGEQGTQGEQGPPGSSGSNNLDLIPLTIRLNENVLNAGTFDSGILLYADTLCSFRGDTQDQNTIWIQFGKDTTVVHNGDCKDSGGDGFIVLAGEVDANFKQGDILVLARTAIGTVAFHEEIYRQTTPTSFSTEMELIPVALRPEQSELYAEEALTPDGTKGILLYADTLCSLVDTDEVRTVWIEFGKETLVQHQGPCNVSSNKDRISLSNNADTTFKQGDVLVLAKDVHYTEVYREQGIPVSSNCTNLRPGADLRGCDLSNLDLQNADLIGVDLSRTDLFDTDFSGASLQSAKFNDAQLSGAKFVGTNLLAADLSRVDLSGNDLSGSELFGSKLIGTDFNGANLSGSNLHNAVAYGADFSNANLNDVKVQGSDFTGAILTNTDLTDMTMDETRFVRVDLTTATIDNVHWGNSYLIESNLQNVDFTGARFGQMTNVDFTGADVSNANFSNLDLSASNFQDADLTGTIFTGCINHPLCQ